MARCVCCGCTTDDDCCVDGYTYNCGGVPVGVTYATAAECAAAAAAIGCPGGGPIPICYCQNIDNECCEDGVCRSICEELPP
jgi:hypothetical protein